MLVTSSLVLLFFVSCCCGLMFPLDSHVLDSFCVTSDDARGIHRLLVDCPERNSEIKGFIKSVGAVVCCVSGSGNTRHTGREIGDKSKRYCDDNGAKDPFVLTFHIVEGEKSDVGEYPHMAALGYETLGDIEFNCGASIISEKFALTAAHCANKREGKPVVVRVGRTSLNLNDREDKGRVVDARVKRVHLHNKYSAARKYHDIALIELENALTFTDTVMPICLQVDNDDHERGRNFTIIGFGISDLRTRTKSDWLMKAYVQEMPLSDCRRQYSKLQISGLIDGIVDSQICARDERENASDTCPGDSGSPLQITKASNKYHLVGITSFGMGCGSSFPSPYTRVSKYIEWIESVVWPSG